MRVQRIIWNKVSVDLGRCTELIAEWRQLEGRGLTGRCGGGRKNWGLVWGLECDRTPPPLEGRLQTSQGQTRRVGVARILET